MFVCFSRSQFDVKILRTGCEKNSCLKNICLFFQGSQDGCQCFWEKGVKKILSKNVFALLGSKFDVRIFEKGVWERNLIKKYICSSWVQSLMSEFLRKGREKKEIFPKKTLVAKYFLSLPWKICNAIFQHFARFWFK